MRGRLVANDESVRECLELYSLEKVREDAAFAEMFVGGTFDRYSLSCLCTSDKRENRHL